MSGYKVPKTPPSLVLTVLGFLGLGVVLLLAARWINGGAIARTLGLGEVPTILAASFLGMAAMLVFLWALLRIVRGRGGADKGEDG